MSKWIVDIHGDIEGDYELICKAESTIPIPKGATNGDMIKTMFPNIKVKPINFEGKLIGYNVRNLDNVTYFTKDFWNAPYRKVEE